MKMKEETICYFKNSGYELRPTYYDFNAYYKKEYEYSYNYNSYKMWKDSRPEWTDEQIEKNREADAKRFADEHATVSRWFGESTELFVLKNSIIICHIKNLPKYGEVTVDFVQKRIDKAEKAYCGNYGGFCESVQALLRREQIDQGFSIYPTTYGIGVWVFLNYHAKECVNTVAELLKKYGIEYYNEFSEARWVFRFKISKKETNRLKMPA